MRDGLGAGGGFAGLIDGDPVVLQGGGLREGGGGEAGLMRRGGIEQGLQMHLHLVTAAGLEDRAALRQRSELNGLSTLVYLVKIMVNVLNLAGAGNSALGGLPNLR